MMAFVAVGALLTIQHRLRRGFDRKKRSQDPDACDMDAFQALACTSFYGKCRTKFPDKVLGVLNIDLANRVIEHLTGVATGSNA